jgi:hypothetical protein
MLFVVKVVSIQKRIENGCRRSAVAIAMLHFVRSKKPDSTMSKVNKICEHQWNLA